MASAVVSTTTTARANAAELRLACETFIPSATTALTLRETSGGVNNHVRYADAASGTYVARVYNNGKATTRVAFEHAVLRAVEPLVAACDLGFVVPRALRARDGSGDTFKILPSGDAASVFELIPGTLPKTRYADAVGEATAALSKCLEACEADVRAIAPTSPTSVLEEPLRLRRRSRHVLTIIIDSFSGDERWCVPSTMKPSPVTFIMGEPPICRPRRARHFARHDVRGC